MIDIVATHGRLTCVAQELAVQRVFRPVGGLVVVFSYDCTPRLVSFGRLAPVLSGIARQIVGTQLAPASQATPASTARFGVVEVLGQCAWLQWLGVDGRHAERFFVPPCVVESATASTLWRAGEALVKPLSMASCKKLCEEVKLMVFHECADSCAANRRLAAFRTQAYDAGGCADAGQDR